jgi:predicted dehydrogenase
LLEKPAARSLAETRRLVELAAEHGVRLAAVHQFPFQRGWQQLERRRRQLGELVHIRFSICSAGGENRTGAERRDILWEMLPHPLSLLRCLAATPLEQVRWDLVARTDDDLEMLGRVNDTRVGISLSLRGRPTRNEVTVTGSGGTAYLDLYHGYGVLEPGTVSWSAKVRRPLRYGLVLLSGAAWNLAQRAWRGEPAYPGLAELIRLFYRSIRGQGPVPVRAEELIEIAQVMERVDALRSGLGRTWVAAKDNSWGCRLAGAPE